MNLELKNLKHNERLSTDSHCFTATLYHDGKRLCIASDDGWGGETVLAPVKGRTYAEIEAINAELANYPDIPMTGYKKDWPQGWKKDGLTLTLDSVASTLVNSVLITRDLTRRLKRKTLALIPSEGKGIYEWTNKYSEDFGRRLSKEYPDIIILNALPFEEAAMRFANLSR